MKLTKFPLILCFGERSEILQSGKERDNVNWPMDYTKHQSQFGINTVMTLVTQFSLTTMESLQNGLQPHSQATPLWSMRTSSQR